ncbi:MAG TPA: transposase [bacterium]|nr:transposase [bacterium]
MPRIERGLFDGFIYHILNRGNGKQTVFHEKYDYQYFVNLLYEAKKNYRVKIFAYCLMPNHYHLVVCPEKGDDLSKMLQWVMTSHVRYFHKLRGTSGHVWQGRYKSFIIKNDAHLLTVLRYVENNPVRARIVNSGKEWLWSSLHQRLENKSNLLDKSPIEIPDNWENFINGIIPEAEITKLRNCIQRQSPFGDSLWQTEICNRFGLVSTLNPRGRPRKGKK